MKVNVLISLYNTKVKHKGKLTSDVVMDTIIDLIKPINYIAYDKKIEIAKRVIEDNKNKEFPTPNMSRSFIIYLINAYTNIELDEDGFDVLSENKMLDLILSTFESEYKICSTILQMCIDDRESG